MIIQLKGKVKYPITLDPTVWIFDDRKIVLEDAFKAKEEEVEVDTLTEAAEKFDRELHLRATRPPVNKSINRFEKEKILVSSYVMPISDFISHAEVDSGTSNAILKTDADDIIITLQQLENALCLFAIDGKPLKEDGPLHVYFGDGSNKDEPIKAVKQIIID